MVDLEKFDENIAQIKELKQKIYKIEYEIIKEENFAKKGRLHMQAFEQIMEMARLLETALQGLDSLPDD